MPAYQLTSPVSVKQHSATGHWYAGTPSVLRIAGRGLVRPCWSALHGRKGERLLSALMFWLLPPPFPTLDHVHICDLQSYLGDVVRSRPSKKTWGITLEAHSCKGQTHASRVLLVSAAWFLRGTLSRPFGCSTDQQQLHPHAATQPHARTPQALLSGPHVLCALPTESGVFCRAI